MGRLAQEPNAVFVGINIVSGGQAMFETMAEVPMAQRIEFPVAEDFQMGFCTGLALAGLLPVAIYPRWDFLLLAANQLVNHLDKLPLMGDFAPKVIIRTAVGPHSPLNAGPQHTQDHSDAFNRMLRTVTVHEARLTEDVGTCYRYATEAGHSCIIVEEAQCYGNS